MSDDASIIRIEMLTHRPGSLFTMGTCSSCSLEPFGGTDDPSDIFETETKETKGGSSDHRGRFWAAARGLAEKGGSTATEYIMSA